MKKIIALICLVLALSGVRSQVRFTRVNPANDQITLKNFGTAPVDISGWRLCSLFDYTANLSSAPVTLISGSLTLAAGDSVTIGGWPLNDAGADLNIYVAAGDFSDASAMVDFMQWGSAGNGRESVAVAKGIWGAGAFITGNAPYRYTGNGTQNGVNFWQATPVPAAIVRLLYVDPTSDEVHIKNFGDTAINISAYRLCSKFAYTADLTTAPLTLVSGSLDLAPGDTVKLSGWPIDDAAADLGLYLAAGAFASPDAMVDFVQWGSAGNGRESVANTKGIWTAGDFITGTPPYTYTGNGTENGLSAWGVSTGIRGDLIGTGYLLPFPNPAHEFVKVRLSLPASLYSQLSIRLYDLQGREVRRIAHVSPNNEFLIERGHLNPGHYYLELRQKNKQLAIEKIQFE